MLKMDNLSNGKLNQSNGKLIKAQINRFPGKRFHVWQVFLCMRISFQCDSQTYRYHFKISDQIDKRHMIQIKRTELINGETVPFKVPR